VQRRFAVASSDVARVLLLNAVDVPSTASCLMPDNGLAALAAALLDAGHHAEIWDPATLDVLRDHLLPEERAEIRRLTETRRQEGVSLELALQMQLLEQLLETTVQRVYLALHRQLERKLAQERIDLLGLKLWFGPGLQAGLKMAESLARRFTQLQVFVGGPMATLMPEALLRQFGVVEGVCVGEGEETIVALADRCDRRHKLTGVPNLVTRDGASFRVAPRSFPDLKSLPRPTYSPEVYPAMGANQKLPIVYVDDSRGCPRRCPFCGHRVFSGHTRREQTPQRVVAHMQAWHEELGARAFRLTGSSTPQRMYEQVASLLSERRSDFLYSGFGHLGSWRGADYVRLRESGLAALFVGIESGSPELLRGTLGKPLNLARLAAQVRSCMDAGIFVCGSVIFPAPGETAETEEQTVAWLLKLFAGKKGCSVPVQPAFPAPYSRWWDDMQGYGFEADRAELLADLLRRRARRFVPLHAVDPLPYRLDGQPFAALSRRAAGLMKRLRQHGILTGMSDETVLIAHAAGYPPRDFHRIDREIFVLADADRMSEVIDRVRRGAHRRTEARTTAEHP
jgi:radical SAM superfamily enzyme YgiQ (UPF0313 family)